MNQKKMEMGMKVKNALLDIFEGPVCSAQCLDVHDDRIRVAEETANQLMQQFDITPIDNTVHVRISELTEKDIGRWVRYTGGAGEQEDGRLKSWNDVFVFVVYKCDGQWDIFQNFTGVATSEADLQWLSMCCKAPMVNGGVQCEACGSNGL